MPVPEYLLAMKCMSARTGESIRDLEDAMFLIRHLRLESASQALSMVEAYYPADQITVKTQYFVEAAFEELTSTRQSAMSDVAPDPVITPGEANASHSL